MTPESPLDQPTPGGRATNAKGATVAVRLGVWMRDETGELNRRRLTGLSMLIVLMLYLVASVPAVVVLQKGKDPNFHARLADSLMHGHLDIRPVPAGLLELSDPYDPTANESFRFAGGAHDFALYEGRLYSVHGPTQAVLLHIPWRLLGLSDPPDYLATLLFVSIGFLAAVGIIVQLRVRFMPTLAVWAECSMIGAVGLATPAWWILTIGRGYESSIACGYALVMTGLAVLLSAMHDPDRPNRWMLALGAFCLAAAVGARPHLFVAGAYLVLTGYFIARSRRRAGATSGLGLDLVALTGPYLFVGALLGAYNLARFGSLTEFGTQYQLSYWNLRTYPLVKLSYLAPNLWDYLVALPRLDAKLPFFFLQESTSTRGPEIRGHFHEGVAGVLPLYPVIPVGLIICAANARKMWRRARPLAVLLGLSLVLALVVLVALSLPFNSSTMRYTVDFAPALILTASIGWGWSYAQYSDRPGVRRVLGSAWVIALTFSIAVGFPLVTTPCSWSGTC